MAVYYVPPTLEGKTLSQLRDEANLSGAGFRSDILASQLGISESTPLSKGQSINVPDGTDFFNSSEGKFLTKNFLTPAQNQPNIVAQARAQFEQDIAPAKATLESQKAPTTDRYNSLLQSIKGQQAVDVQKAGITATNELGRRGVPISSTSAQQFIQGQQTPVNVAYEGLSATTEGQLQDRLNAINSAIASLQSGQPQYTQNELDRAVNQLQFDTNSSLQKQQLELTKQGQQQGYDIQQKQLALQSQPQQTPFEIVNIGGRGYIFDPRTGTIKQQLQTQFGGGGFNTNDWSLG